MISVRLAELQDVERISLVLAASWKAAYQGIINDGYLRNLTDSHWVKFLTDGLSGGAVFSMILQDANEIIGVAIVGTSEETNEARLISLYLLPGKIGQGFGHIFYNSIEKELINRGFDKCVLDVLENNKMAISFYTEHGFTNTNTETVAMLDGKSYICKVFEKML